MANGSRSRPPRRRRAGFSEAVLDVDTLWWLTRRAGRLWINELRRGRRARRRRRAARL